MSLSTQQLRDRLDAIIKQDPKTAHLPVTLSQYDTVGVNTGEETCYSADVKHDRVVLG